MTEETKAALLVDQIIKRIEGEIENLKSKIGDMPTQSPKMVPVAVVVISA
ncbi:hypothetical protein JHR29_09370 [Campylobacter jejuni]|nr:hypothetical protein [Campylobacter jejuni]